MVVDIFSSKGSHMPFSRMLPDVLEELGIFALHFVFLCGILFLVKRFRSRLLALSAAFLMPFFQLFFVWKVSIHSEVFLSVALAFLLTVQIRLLDLIPFHTEDLLFLFFSVFSHGSFRLHISDSGEPRNFFFCFGSGRSLFLSRLKPGQDLFRDPVDLFFTQHSDHRPFFMKIVGSPAYFVSLPFSMIPIFSSHRSNAGIGCFPRISRIVPMSW